VETSFWSAQTVPIVLLPAGEQGGRILNLARDWVELGLLGPALWVSPESVSIIPGAPPFVMSRVLRLGPDGDIIDVSRDLFQMLARDDLSHVRVLKVRSATARKELDREQDAIASSLLEYVRFSVPSADPNQSVADQTLKLSDITLICAPTEFQVSERVNWARDDTGIVVVASPEDRSSPWSGDAFVRDDERFVGFCLLHIASVGGLWNASPVGTFDLFSQEASMHQSIWLSRIFVNAVLMGGFARRVAAGVLEDVVNGNANLVDASDSIPPRGMTFIPPERLDHYRDRVVEGVFQIDSGKLDYHPVSSFDTRAKLRLSFQDQFVSFVSFALDKIVAMPRWVWRWIRDLVSRKTTETFHSDDGLAVVGVDPSEYDIRDRALLGQRERVQAEVITARAATLGAEDATIVRSTPALWSRLREVVFGVLDGSADLSEIGFAPIDDKTPIFARLSDVIPAPDVSWTRPAESDPDGPPVTIALGQFDEAGTVRDELQRWATEADQIIAHREIERRNALAELEKLESRREQLATSLRDSELVEVGSDGEMILTPAGRALQKKPSQEPAEAEKSAQVKEFAASEGLIKQARRRVDRAESIVGSDDSALRARAEVVADLDRWRGTHGASVYGRIVTGMAERRGTAAKNLAALEAELNAAELPEPGQLLTLRKSFHRRVLIGAAIVLGLVALYLLVSQMDTVISLLAWWPNLWEAIAISLGVGAVALTRALIRYYREWSRFERRIVDSGDHLEWVAGALTHTGSELRRLRALHPQAQEWLLLLAGALHRPWTVKESWLSTEAPAVDRSRLPYAMRLAVSRDDDVIGVGRVTREASRALLIKGWRAQAFARLLEEIRLRLGYEASALSLDTLDADLPHASNHSRQILDTHIADPDVLASVAQTYLREIVGEVQKVSLSNSNPRVSLLVADPLDDDEGGGMRARADASMEWDRFLIESVAGRNNPVTPIGSLGFAEMALAEAHHENVESYLLVPDRLVEKVSPGGNSARLHIQGYPDHQVRPVDLVLRIDIAGPIPVGAARLWERANSATPVRPKSTTAPQDGL
jgi:hypothetical protein